MFIHCEMMEYQGFDKLTLNKYHWMLVRIKIVFSKSLKGSNKKDDYYRKKNGFV